MAAPKNSGLTPQQALTLSIYHTYNGQTVILDGSVMGPLPSNEIWLSTVLSGSHVPPVTGLGGNLTGVFSSNFPAIFGQTSNIALGLAGVRTTLAASAFAVLAFKSKEEKWII